MNLEIVSTENQIKIQASAYTLEMADVGKKKQRNERNLKLTYPARTVG